MYRPWSASTSPLRLSSMPLPRFDAAHRTAVAYLTPEKQAPTWRWPLLLSEYDSRHIPTFQTPRAVDFEYPRTPLGRILHLRAGHRRKYPEQNRGQGFAGGQRRGRETAFALGDCRYARRHLDVGPLAAHAFNPRTCGLASPGRRQCRLAGLLLGFQVACRPELRVQQRRLG